MKEVLILSLVNETSPALRYRVTLPMEILKNKDQVSYDKLIFYSNDTTKSMNGDNNLLKILNVIKDFINFTIKFIKIKKCYDIVIVKNNIFPILGSRIEKIVFNKFKNSKIIYDIDDAIYMNETRKNNEAMKKFRDADSKVGFWYKNCDILLVSNRIIRQDLLERYNYKHKNVIEFLTCPLSKQYFENKEDIIKYKESKGVNFIWLGSPHTQENLRLMNEFIINLSNKVKKPRVFIIGVHKEFELFRDLDYVEFIDWSPENEKKYMQISHIGLNPLLDNKFEQRKSAFKVIQYYRAGILPIVSDTGINKELTERYGGYCTNEFDLEETYSFINNSIENKKISLYLYENSHDLTLESNKEKIKNAIQSL